MGWIFWSIMVVSFVTFVIVMSATKAAKISDKISPAGDDPLP